MSIKRIAKLANVSIGTVDRVLNKRPGVSKETEKRVLSIIKDIGYTKNTTASRLKLAAVKKIKIAVLIPKSGDRWSYWKLPKNGVLEAIEELSELGVMAEFYNFSNVTTFIEQQNSIFLKKYDAIVTVPFFKEASQLLLNQANEKNTPVVFLDTEIAFDDDTNFIGQNAYQAGMVAGRLLHGLVGDTGHYYIVNFTIDNSIHESGKQREEGFRAFFKQLGKTVNIQTINYPVTDSFKISSNMLSQFENEKKKGIFVTNSRAYSIPPILQEHKIDNTHILGFDLNDKNRKCLGSCEISFILDQNPKLQGYAAVKGLYKFLTEQNDSELNRDIPIAIIVKENLPET